jgi:predicted permease
LSRVSLTGRRYASSSDVFRFQEELITRLRQDPNIIRVATTTVRPLSGGEVAWVTVAGRDLPDGVPPAILIPKVSEGFFRTMGVTLLAGRFFDERDREETQLVTVVNETMARQFFPDQDPLGQRIRFGPDFESEPFEIVGVVSDMLQSGRRRQTYPAAFLHNAQRSRASFYILTQVREAPLSVAGAVRSAVQAQNPELPLFGTRTLADVVRGSRAVPRFLLLLTGVFAGLSLVLASVGIFGVVAHAVSQRTHEIGIRIALGARKEEVLSHVLKQGVVLGATALLLGLPVAFALSRVLRSVLFEIDPSDPLTFVVTSALVVVVAALASFIPARRAAGMSALRALRSE